MSSRADKQSTSNVNQLNELVQDLTEELFRIQEDANHISW